MSAAMNNSPDEQSRRSSRWLERSRLVPSPGGRPDGPNLLRERLADFLDLMRFHVVIESPEYGNCRIQRVDRPSAAQPLLHVIEKDLRGTLLKALLGRMPLVVVEAAHQQRKLRTQMGREPELEA